MARRGTGLQSADRAAEQVRTSSPPLSYPSLILAIGVIPEIQSGCALRRIRLRVLLEVGTPVALVFADIVMPGGMTGYDVAKWVRSRRSDLKVLLTSGCANPPAAANDGIREIKVLGKPYTRENLAQAVRETLNGSIEGLTKGASGADVCGKPSTVIPLRRPKRLR